MDKFNLYLFIVLTLCIILSIKRYIHNNDIRNIKLPKISITPHILQKQEPEVNSDELNSLFEADLFTDDGDIDSEFTL